MSEVFRVYVGKEVIYSGHLSEMPDYYRRNLVEAVSEWGECLSKSGFRELLYSSLHWYTTKTYYCADCGAESEDDEPCPECGGKMSSDFVHKRNPEIDKIMMCISLIDRVEMEVP